MSRFALPSLAVSLALACSDQAADDAPDSGRDYRQDMRDFVGQLSSWAKGRAADFIVIPQNGIELVTESGAADGTPAGAYLAAIDGAGQEDLFYGYDDDDVATPTAIRDYLIGFLDIAEDNGVEALVTNYCWDPDKVDDAYVQSGARGYISFSAPERDLNVIPDYPTPIYAENSDDVDALSSARNFLYLLDSGDYAGDRDSFLSDLQGTDYDVLIIDAFFEDGQGDLQWFEAPDVNSLKAKKNGASRLVIAYMSIGEAENYRYYWQADWDADGDGLPDDDAPGWLAEENPDWEGNYKVRYWDPAWQAIIYGNEASYLGAVLDAGFDGVYLDIIDAFEYFE